MERESDGVALPKYGSLLEDAIQMRERLNREGRPFRSLAEVKRCHNRLAANVNYGENGRNCWVLDLYGSDCLVLDLQFPPPPIPGTERILALDSPDLLIDEGRKQRHCVAIKAEEVASGQMYVYRILGPERATLSIIRTGAGWEFGELCGPGNRPVAERTKQFVRNWFLRTQDINTPCDC
jgi:hypothetical protein